MMVASSGEISMSSFNDWRNSLIEVRGVRISWVTPAARVADPLWAKGLVLTGAGEPIVIVALDWCQCNNDSYDRWRDVLAEADFTFRPRGAPTLRFLAGLRVYSLDETLTILGLSGSGKSMLCRAILGLVPSQGEILFNGHDAGKLSASAMNRIRGRKIGVVLQNAGRGGFFARGRPVRPNLPSYSEPTVSRMSALG